MRLRSSRIVGIPNYSNTMTHIPCYSYRSRQNVICMNIICIYMWCIVASFFTLYGIFHFFTNLQDEMIEPSSKFNLSDLLTDVI